MNSYWENVLIWIPRISLVSFAICLALIFVGWNWSVKSAMASKERFWIRVLVYIPITYPLAFPFYAKRNWKDVRGPLVCYAASILVLPLSGLLAEFVEKRRLAGQIESLEQSGELISLETLTQEPELSDRNIWAHSFFVPLASAGRRDAVGEAARERKDYAEFKVPSPDPRIVYNPPSKPTFGGGLKKLHSLAITDLMETNGSTSKSTAPVSWNGIGEAVIERYQSAEPKFRLLREALERPDDQYPLQWNDGFFMLLPHLSAVKKFTQCASIRSAAFAATGDGNRAFEELLLAMKLARTGHSDILIARLVQFAKYHTLLNAIQTAQSFHVWEDAQWQILDESLAELEFLSLIPNAIREERVVGRISIEPILKLSPLGMYREFEKFADKSNENDDWIKVLNGLVNLVSGGHFKAALTRQWIECLNGYEWIIDEYIRVNEQLETQAWSEINLREPVIGLNGFGLIAGMFLPSLNHAAEKAQLVETHVELARVGIALERFRIQQGEYPEDLDSIFHQFPELLSTDPMTGENWRYRKLEEGGFRLYSLGLNGVDDGGFYKGDKVESFKWDDLTWQVFKDPPVFEFSLEEPKLMERYFNK